MSTSAWTIWDQTPPGTWPQAIAAVDAAKVDLILIAGDLTDAGTREEMAVFKRKLKQFNAPVLFVPGNHDVGEVGKGKGKTSITAERVKLFASKVGPNWYARDEAGVRIIGINSLLFGSGLKAEKEQWKFLEKELAKPHPKPTFLMEHYPLVGTRHVQPEVRERLLHLLEQGGVRTVLTGHLHYPTTNRVDGILFLSNFTTAWGLPRGKQPEGWMLLTVPREGEVQFESRRLEGDRAQ